MAGNDRSEEQNMKRQTEPDVPMLITVAYSEEVIVTDIHLFT